MQSTKNEPSLEPLYLPPKQKTKCIDKVKDESDLYATSGIYLLQDRSPSHSTASRQSLSFFVSHKHPFQLSMNKSLAPQFQLTQACLPTSKQPQAAAIVASLNSNKDKTDLPTQYDWRLFHTQKETLCAVLDIPYYVFASSINKVGPLLTKQHLQKVRAAKLFCEQYADINHGLHNNHMLPLAKFQITGSTVDQNEPQRIRIIVPIPSFMKAEDLEPLYAAHAFNWLRFSSNSYLAAIPLDADTDSPQSVEEYKRQLHSSNQSANSDAQPQLVEISSTRTGSEQSRPDGRDDVDQIIEQDQSMQRLCYEALSAHGFLLTDITKAKEISCLHPILHNTPAITHSQSGLIIQLQTGSTTQMEQQQKILNRCLHNAQIASMMPQRPGTRWSIGKGGMIICTFDQVHEVERARLQEITEKFHGKAMFREQQKQLVLFDSQLNDADYGNIGAIIANTSNASFQVETKTL